MAPEINLIVEIVLIFMAIANVALWFKTYRSNGHYLANFTSGHALQLVGVLILLLLFDFALATVDLSVPQPAIILFGQWWRFFFYVNLWVIGWGIRKWK